MIDDPGQLRLEPSEGQRVSGPAGERLLVGLAALVLGGGALLAIIGAIAGEEVATASGAPRATQAAGTDDPQPRPSRTPRPSPTPRPPATLVLDPGVPDPSDRAAPFFGWVRATTEVPVYLEPEVGAHELGRLAAGDVGYAHQPDPASGDDWLYLEEPQPAGWILTTDADGERIERIPEASFLSSTEIWSVHGGADGFLAIGWSPAEPGGTMLLASPDGEAWERVGGLALGGWRGALVAAHGPVGWIAATNTQIDDAGGDGLSIWRSSDGQAWSALGSARDLYPHSLVGSGAGYLLATYAGEGPRLWYSPDGVSWEESLLDPWLDSRGTEVRIIGTEDGFHAIPIEPERDRALPTSAYSADGLTWSAVYDGPTGPRVQIVDVGGEPERRPGVELDRPAAQQIIALDVAPQDGAVRVWHGWIESSSALRGVPGITWSRVREAEKAFEGVALTVAASDGSRVVAFGWDRVTDGPLTLTTLDGIGWERAALPSGEYGGMPQVAAGGAGGFVVVGHRPTLGGANPIFWHETSPGSWAPEATPVVELVPDPAADDCPPPPNEVLDLLALSTPRAIACFGGDPLTIAGWARACDECRSFGPGFEPGTYEPEWLASQDVQLFVSPIGSSSSFVGGLPVVAHPSLEWPFAGGRWVALTGHFDDPAATTCRWEPSPVEEAYYPGRQAVIDACRGTFVVTAVEPLEEP